MMNGEGAKADWVDMTDNDYMSSRKGNGGGNKGKSFKKARLARKKSRGVKGRHKTQGFQAKGPNETQGFSGSAAETGARLTPDPLVLFRKKNILNDQQIRAFERIRKVIQIIVDGTQARISRFNDVVVQTSHWELITETEYEIYLQVSYTTWVDRMAESHMPVGPILDIIMEELSFNAVDRKWGRRKGWAKQHLQRSLDLYTASSCPKNRYK